jgi:hypothetical protein
MPLFPPAAPQRARAPRRSAARAMGRLPLAGILVVALAGCLPLKSDGTRDPGHWPFATHSPWNMPIGSNAGFQGAWDGATASILDTRFHATTNFERYSHPVHFASTSDPWATFSRPDGVQGPWSFHVPHHAAPAAGGDRHMHIVSPDRRTVHESWRTEGGNPWWSTGHLVATDLRGSGVGPRPGVSAGVRSYGGSALGGLIRKHEIEHRHIPHAVAMALTSGQLRRGYVWPATSEDGGGRNGYHGQAPMGTLMAIPPHVDIHALGLNPDGLALARALQDYGGYATDQSDSFVMGFVEPGADGARVAAMRADLDRIRLHLRVVTNNSPHSVGGGGTPRAPLAPDLR